MREYIGTCYYGDCTHIHEPECGVKEAVGKGRIAKARYDSYTDIYKEIEDRRRF